MTPADQFTFVEPEVELFVGGIEAVRSMCNQLFDVDAVGAPDGRYIHVEGLCLTEHAAALTNDISSFPAHGDNGSRCHGGAISFVEVKVCEFNVVLLPV